MDILTILNTVLLGCILLFLLMRGRGEEEKTRQIIDQELDAQFRLQRTEQNETIHQAMRHMEDAVMDQVRDANNAQILTIRDMDANLYRALGSQETRFEAMRQTIDDKMEQIRNQNEKSLDKISNTVDQKLDETLRTRMNESFQQVSTRLEEVHKGLGEMQSLAKGVGDLQKVLSNVKTRGIIGELQLAAILEEILSPDQYEREVRTNPNRSDSVEFAIRIPTDAGKTIYLPIDAKFPQDYYARLKDAYDTLDKKVVEAAATDLTRRIREEAKTIRRKYICVPDTTEFAILFVPFEGMYAELVNLGMIETLQRESRVLLAGPSTLAAILNSLQMGFKTIAIQQRTSEVWHVLSDVRTEFEKFEGSLKQVQTRLRQSNDEIEKLVGVRMRQMQKQLTGLSELKSEDENNSALPDRN